MRFSRVSSGAMVVCVFLISVASFGWAQRQSSAVEVKATKHAFAPPLNHLQPIPPRSGGVPSPSDNDESRVENSVSFADAVSSTLSVNAGLNILGVGTGFHGFAIQAAVAVPNGAPGPTQFFQIVNESFAVFNKSTGALEYGPADGNTLWQALGAPCS